MTTVTLTGYLGSDPDFRETRSRTYEKTLVRRERFLIERFGRQVRDAEDQLEESQEIEVTTRSRGYVTFSLATHEGCGSQRRTTWHRVVAWNTDREHRVLRYCRQGDRIEITGRRSSFLTEDGRDLEQIELTSCRILRSKVRNPLDHPRFGRITREAMASARF